MKMPRRDFLKAAPVATFALVQTARGMDLPTPAPPARIKLEPFDYQGVRLRESRWLKQYQAARDFWLGLSEDDILHVIARQPGCRHREYRLAAGAV